MSLITEEKKAKKITKSIRISLNAKMADAFDYLKRNYYPFLSEDEILKLAFSRLYHWELANDESSRHTTILDILTNIRQQNPDFGKKWMKDRGLNESDINEKVLSEMIAAETKS
jgi:hypothetical protein